MKRKALIAANWKMNKDINESLIFINRLSDKEIDYNKVDVLIAPPFTSLYCISCEIKKKLPNLLLSAQNIYFEKEGAFTGEISAKMVGSTGATFTILGHSERRQYFKEDDEIINKKIKAALDFNLNIILCIGENIFEREADVATEVVLSQLGRSLKDINNDFINNIVIAYEPVWAIGTGKTASSEDANDMHSKIRGKIKDLYNYDVAENIKILYGGSVKPENIKELMNKEHIDGALVGGASLDVEKFYKIISFYNQ
ncbi:MAG: triose-phosphate isomerase [Deferribacterota bacterium]|nr:triose-phosphate isomerase [Deferribacterota bacterium]